MSQQHQREFAKPSSNALQGKTILVTRAKEQAGEFSEVLKQYGADVVEVPTVHFVEPESWDGCDRAIEGIAAFQSIVFTSANAVEFFFSRFQSLNRSVHECRNISLYAVGSKTQEAIAQFELSGAVLSSSFTGKDFANALKPLLEKGTKVLFPHGNFGRHDAVQILRDYGIVVTEIEVYRNVEPTAEEQRALCGTFDVITFFSPSSVKNFLKIVPSGTAARSIIAVIGPTTEQAARNLGLPVHIVPQQSTATELANAIALYFGHQ